MIASNLADFCNDTAPLLQFVGYALLIFKIAIPIIIIVLGILDFGKAVVADKSDDVKTYAKRLLWRVVAGIVIFFVPNVITWAFGLIAEYGKEEGTFSVCRECILKPSGESCKEAIGDSKDNK